MKKLNLLLVVAILVTALMAQVIPAKLVRLGSLQLDRRECLHPPGGHHHGSVLLSDRSSDHPCQLVPAQGLHDYDRLLYAHDLGLRWC